MTSSSNSDQDVDIELTFLGRFWMLGVLMLIAFIIAPFGALILFWLEVTPDGSISEVGFAVAGFIGGFFSGVFMLDMIRGNFARGRVTINERGLRYEGPLGRVQTGLWRDLERVRTDVWIFSDGNYIGISPSIDNPSVVESAWELSGHNEIIGEYLQERARK